MRQSLTRLGPAAVAIPGIAAALLLGGCGSGQDNATVKPSGPSTPGSSAPGRAGKTRLTITVRDSQTAQAKTRTLTCDPVGGDLAKAKEACAALTAAGAAGQDPFAPTPKNVMCTQIYGGPETATVTGTWNGKKVDSTFSRKNGCEIKRWGTLGVLFGPHPPVR
ncbi:SSI family serine proteinase inhibitor [Actinoallomurus sp. CA-150999]|uniref:SSI family serine proteinase inhibitor n=1 Tax=Actinoallomurus sp. CA-150999 TaxID=3239887 RepID=UPI003D8C62EA